MTAAQRKVLEAMAKGDTLVHVDYWWFLCGDDARPVHGMTVRGLFVRGYIALLAED